MSDCTLLLSEILNLKIITFTSKLKTFALRNIIYYKLDLLILFLLHIVVNAKALSIMRYQDDINTEHNIKSIGRVAVAQWTKRLTRNGQTRVRIREAHIFDNTIRGYRAEAGNQQSSPVLSQTRIAMRTLPLNKGGGNVVSAICAIVDEINTEHNMKSICRPAVAQWTERLTRKGQTRVRNWKGANILLSQYK